MTQTIEYFELFLGESVSRVIQIRNKDLTPYDLSGATEIQVRFKKSDGQALIKTLNTESPLLGGVTVVNAIKGQLQVALSPSESGLLKLGERQDFTVIVFKGTVASVTSGPIQIKANEPGTASNGIALSFDGTKTVDQAVADYNAMVAPAQEVHVISGGSNTPASGTTLSLAGGTDSKRVAVVAKGISVLKSPV